jgi:cytochrome d ubiquinol oxidase subunit II
MTVGIVWWVIGIVLALGYFLFVYRTFKGKVRTEFTAHEGY